MYKRHHDQRFHNVYDEQPGTVESWNGCRLRCGYRNQSDPGRCDPTSCCSSSSLSADRACAREASRLTQSGGSSIFSHNHELWTTSSRDRDEVRMDAFCPSMSCRISGIDARLEKEGRATSLGGSSPSPSDDRFAPIQLMQLWGIWPKVVLTTSRCGYWTARLCDTVARALVAHHELRARYRKAQLTRTMRVFSGRRITRTPAPIATNVQFVLHHHCRRGGVLAAGCKR